MAGEAGAGATRQAARPQQMPAWLRRAFAAPNALYAHGLGAVLGRRFVQIGHVGRRSGRSYHSVVEVLHYDRSTGETVVIAGYGHRSDWLRNVRAAGGPELDLGHGPRPAAYRMLSTDEAMTVFRDYLRRNALIRPVLRPVLSALLGWRFDGSEAALRRMVEQLPMVAFRPR